MTTKKQDEDISYTVAVAGRVLNDANASYLVVGIDVNGIISATMTLDFGTAVKALEYTEKTEDGLFRFGRLQETLVSVSDVLTGAEIEHRRQYGIPMNDKDIFKTVDRDEDVMTK